MKLIYAGRRLSTKGTLLHIYRDATDPGGSNYAFRKALTHHPTIGWGVTVENDGPRVRVLDGQVSLDGLSDSALALIATWAAEEAADLAAHQLLRDQVKFQVDARDLGALTLDQLRDLYATRRTRAARAGLVATVDEYVRGR